MPKPELLMPAGNLEKLRNAVLFGADAVYAGAGPYSLRASSQTSFNLAQLKEGLEFARAKNVKVYLAMNIYAFDEDISAMRSYLAAAKKMGIDAVIISDVGLLPHIDGLKIHLSTQANTLNSEAVKFWKNQGISRIVLGRELSFARIKKIREAVPGIELEVFVHGAMCIAYSGRCLLSKHMAGRFANRGECAQPCRWEYRLKETTRPEEEFKIEEDQRGTYIMNSRDLCLIEHLPELTAAGIDSFKIEGRMKSPYYTALVAKIYRRALDTVSCQPALKEELEKVSHRTYSTAFFAGDPGADAENISSGASRRSHIFVGVVKSHGRELEVSVRNRLCLNDELEAIDPEKEEIVKFRVRNIRDMKNNLLEAAHNDCRVFIETDLPGKISPFSVLRKKL